jgi:hypothetical protein
VAGTARKIGELGIVSEIQLLQGCASCDLVGQPFEVVGGEGELLDALSYVVS